MDVGTFQTSIGWHCIRIGKCPCRSDTVNNYLPMRLYVFKRRIYHMEVNSIAKRQLGISKSFANVIFDYKLILSQEINSQISFWRISETIFIWKKSIELEKSLTITVNDIITGLTFYVSAKQYI